MAAHLWPLAVVHGASRDDGRVYREARLSGDRGRLPISRWRPCPTEAACPDWHSGRRMAGPYQRPPSFRTVLARGQTPRIKRGGPADLVFRDRGDGDPDQHLSLPPDQLAVEK
ncbi:MAG: hypothetical protein JWL75_619 [Parcubacteria group bacterium]|nr:hypothetical protein [Parcubacteria group bacterium]